jgi:hypothetical protein
LFPRPALAFAGVVSAGAAQLVLPRPIVPSSETLDRPAAVVQGVGSFVVNATAPCTALRLWGIWWEFQADDA